ncbi:MAG: hypothetical protein IJ493_11300 [Clostridia bacterium]|nr:hypothetical protein [Clostridia bacterium]
MVKKIFALILTAAFSLTSISCSESEPVVQSEDGYSLYWIDMPVGKKYSDDLSEFEYEYTHYITTTDGQEYTHTISHIEETLTTFDGDFAIRVYHWESEDAGYFELQPKLQIFSQDNLSARLYAFEFLPAEYTDGFPPTISFPELSHLTATPDGGFAAYLSGRSVEFAFAVWDKDGSRVLTLDADTFPYAAATHDFIVSQDGNIYFMVEQSICVMSPEGKHLGSVDIPENYFKGMQPEMVHDADGNIVLRCAQQKLLSNGYVLLPVDNGAQKLGAPLNLPDVDPYKPILASGYDVFYVNSTGIYGANKNGQIFCLISWFDYDLLYENLLAVNIVSAECIYIAATDPADGSAMMGCITTNTIDNQTPQKISTEKQILTLAYVSNGSTYNPKTIEIYVNSFNLKSREYRVKLVQYEDMNGLSPSNQLVKEMLSGNVPDMVMFDADMNPEAFSALNMFRDIYPYIDSDSDYSRDSFMPCILEPMENSDGELPYLSLQFGISYISGLTSVVGDNAVWSLKDLAEFSVSLSDEMALIYADSKNYTSDADTLLRAILPDVINRYVDIDARAGDFGDELKTLLELCMSANVFQSDTVEEPAWYAKQQVALRYANVSTVELFLRNKYGFLGGEQVSSFTISSDSSENVMLIPKTCIAMTKESQLAEGGWSFIKYCLDYQQKSAGSNTKIADEAGFPCTKAAIDRMFETLRNYYFYLRVAPSQFSPDRLSHQLNLNGTLKPGEGEEYPESIQKQMQDPTYTFYTLTEEDEAALRALFDNVKTVRSYDTELLSIIYEDAAYYFAGVKSLEDTVRIIEDRVDTLLNE